MYARTEGVADLFEVDGPLSRGKGIEQDLIAHPTYVPYHLVEEAAVEDCKKPLMGSDDPLSENELTELSSCIADELAVGSKLPHTAAIRMPCADDNIEIVALECGEHVRKYPLVMLQVTIHDSQKRCV